MNKGVLARRSIALRLLVSIIPITLLGILLVGGAAYYITKQHIVETVKKDIHTLGFEASQNISSFLNQRKNDLDTLSEQPLFADHYNNLEFGLEQEAETYRKEIEIYLANFSKRAKVYKGIYYLNPEGREICRIESSEIRPAAGYFPYDSLIQELRDLRSQEHFMSVPMVASHLGLTVFYAKALYNNIQKRKGIIVLACDLKPVEEILGRLRTGSSGVVYLADANKAPLLPASVPFDRFYEGNTAFFSVSSPVSGTPWQVSVLANMEDFLKPLNRIRFICSMLIVFCGALTVIVIYFRIRYLIGPIKKLMEATERLASGNLPERIRVKGNDEIATLSQSFNTMAESLQRKAQENQKLLEEVRHSEARYRTTLDSSLDAIIGADSFFIVTTWNRGAQKLFRFDTADIVGKPIACLFREDASKELLKIVSRDGFVRNHDIEGLTKDGELLNLNLTWAGSQESDPEHQEWSIVIRDVTDQKKLQAQLIHAEKLSIVGRLISGVVHEINNPLTAVVGYAELLATQEEMPSQLREDLKYIHENAVRCRDIMGNLLRFSRKEKLKKRPIQIKDVVVNAIKLMEYRLMKTEFIEVHQDLPHDLPPVFADSRQLEQVMVNLIQNACDALTEISGPKRLSIKGKRQDDFVIVSVEDNGPGIPQNLRNKIFEPFFTTKEEGKGTGLGLAICQDILQEHGGSLSIDNSSASGTRFLIKLHIFKRGTIATQEESKTIPPIPNKRVLIIDDETDLLPLMRQVLIEDGDKVEIATSGQDGLQKLTDGYFDLVISDFRLGPLNGSHIFYAIQTLNKKPPLLFITGDLMDAEVLETVTTLGVPCLSKPFSLGDFRFNVRKLLAN